MGGFVFRLWVVAMLVTFIQLKEETCPSKLNGCTCENLPNGTFHLGVTCTNIANEKAFKSNLDAMEGTKLDSLTLSGLKFWPWPKDAFKKLFIEFMYINNCFVSKLYGQGKLPLFNGMAKSLVYLEFNTVNLTKFKWTHLSGLGSLKMLKVLHTPIRKLFKSISEVGYGNLSSIAFIHNGMTKINKFALHNQGNVAEIIIEKNYLTELKRNMFPHPAYELMILSFEDNQITDLPVDLFTEMEKLEFLNLKKNKLQSLSVETFRPIISQLQLLTISLNPFNCDCKLEWLIKKMENFEGGADMEASLCEKPQKLQKHTLISLAAEKLTC